MGLLGCKKREYVEWHCREETSWSRVLVCWWTHGMIYLASGIFADIAAYLNVKRLITV